MYSYDVQNATGAMTFSLPPVICDLFCFNIEYTQIELRIQTWSLQCMYGVHKHRAPLTKDYIYIVEEIVYMVL